MMAMNSLLAITVLSLSATSYQQQMLRELQELNGYLQELEQPGDSLHKSPTAQVVEDIVDIYERVGQKSGENLAPRDQDFFLKAKQLRRRSR